MTVKNQFYFISNLSKTYAYSFSINSFKCPDLLARDGDKCYYKNETLNHSEYLKGSVLGGMCTAACYCRKGHGEKPSEFQCAHVDCPEFKSHEPTKNCVRQYDNTHCCSIKNVCGKFFDWNSKQKVVVTFPLYLNQMMMLINCQHACLKANRIVKVKRCIRTNTATNVSAPRTSIMKLQ